MTSAENPWAGFHDHERALVAQDARTGIRMVVAIHSTVLGPALGGVRMSAYAASADPQAAAYADALRLSRAMTYKNALAGLDHGGGKGVIIAEPTLGEPVRRQALEAFGRLVASCNGAYVTAGDVGVQVADMDVISEVCPWTTGRSVERGGAGDSAILTALGVFEAMRATAGQVWGTTDLTGRRIGIVGVGKVGGRLAGHLLEAGAVVTAFDTSHAAAAAATQAGVQMAATLDEVVTGDFDILSPNALGGLLTLDLVPALGAPVICGAANNQLATSDVAQALADRGIVYAPDFVVNSGGVIQIAEELTGLDMDRARGRTLAIGTTTARVLTRARADGVTPVVAAEREAEDRLARARGTTGT